jgi:hypothetical protein
MLADDRLDADQPGHDMHDRPDDSQSEDPEGTTEDPTQERVNPLPPLPDIGEGAATDKASAWYDAELLLKVRNSGVSRFLVQWTDVSPNTWQLDGDIAEALYVRHTKTGVLRKNNNKPPVKHFH